MGDEKCPPPGQMHGLRVQKQRVDRKHTGSSTAADLLVCLQLLRRRCCCDAVRAIRHQQHGGLELGHLQEQDSHTSQEVGALGKASACRPIWWFEHLVHIKRWDPPLPQRSGPPVWATKIEKLAWQSPRHSVRASALCWHMHKQPPRGAHSLCGPHGTPCCEPRYQSREAHARMCSRAESTLRPIPGQRMSQHAP